MYIHGIEAYDKTPVLGIRGYDSTNDYVENPRVPSYLSHWPKQIDFSSNQDTNDTLFIQDSSLISLLEKTNHHLEKESFEQETKESSNQDGISVFGAKENNLKNVNCFIPFHQITAVVGVSGSGKSSLVKSTIYQECKRKMEYLSYKRSFVQNLLLMQSKKQPPQY